MCAHACCPPVCICAENSEIDELDGEKSYGGEKKVDGQKKATSVTLQAMISKLL